MNKKIKLQIASDLHLEFQDNKKWLEENPLIHVGDILLLAGDIVVDKYREKAEKFYKVVERDFSNVISVMGNHEFYRGDVSYAYPSYFKQVTEKHVKLNNKSIVIDGVKFIVSVLWSFVLPQYTVAVWDTMNDYALISTKDAYGIKVPLIVETTNKYHQISLDFIKEELSKPFDGKVVVMTHHLPSYRLINPKCAGNPVNCAFATDLDELIESNPQIAIWVCGHSHEFADVVIGSTRVVANPLGYVCENEHQGFKRDFCVEV
ncbi:MAG: metallophosphoesterase [Candidatus Gracilibacteria bacterium]